MLKTLRTERSFQKALLETAANCRRATSAYFHQEGLLDNIEWGIVDVGWIGSLQRALDGILFENNRRVKHGYYFGLDRSPEDEVNLSARAYLFDHRLGLGGHLQPPHIRTLVEVFLRADHGMTKGYDQKDGRSIPKFVEDETRLVIEWGLSFLGRSVKAFVETLEISNISMETFRSSRSLACKLLCTFWEHPADEEVAVWGAIPFGGEQTGERWFAMSQPLSYGDLFQSALRLRLPRKHPDEWVLGSIRQSAPVIRSVLERPFLAACRLRRFSRGIQYINPDNVLNRLRALKRDSVAWTE